MSKYIINKSESLKIENKAGDSVKSKSLKVYTVNIIQNIL